MTGQMKQGKAETYMGEGRGGGENKWGPKKWREGKIRVNSINALYALLGIHRDTVVMAVGNQWGHLWGTPIPTGDM